VYVICFRAGELERKCLCQHNEETKRNASEAFQISYFVTLLILEIEEFQPLQVENFLYKYTFQRMKQGLLLVVL
jgi:hypothetical protein